MKTYGFLFYLLLIKQLVKGTIYLISKKLKQT
jgi:hypothetical protein